MRLGPAVSLLGGKLVAVWMLLRRFPRHVHSIGFMAAAVILFCEALMRHPLAELVEPKTIERVRIRPAGYPHSVRLRRVGTDVAVFSQMLVQREYEPVSSLRDVRLIIDCGANIGLSAYYLLHCYPSARLIAIEPDPENCALCRQNLASFGSQAMVMQAAVWPENRQLRIAPASRASGPWSLEVEPWDTGDVAGLTIPEILRRADETGPIDLLKMDIEGAETAIFASSPGWLNTTRNIAIELHGPSAVAAFSAALDGYRYEQRLADELTVIYGLRRERA
jgi:FkbM family methyltransferase